MVRGVLDAPRGTAAPASASALQAPKTPGAAKATAAKRARTCCGSISTTMTRHLTPRKTFAKRGKSWPA